MIHMWGLFALTESVSAATSTSPDGPSRTDIYHVLSNERRRYVLHYLLQQEDNAASKYELSKQVAAWENGVPIEEVTSSQRKRVYVALHQNHVPQMIKRGTVEYADDQVVLADDVEDIDVYMDVVRGGDIPWSQFYLGLGTVGGGATVAGWVGLIPFSLLPGYVWALVVALSVAVTGAVHTYLNRKHRLGMDGAPPECRDGTDDG